MLVIFDCDGVLVDSEPLVNRVEAEFVSARGWSATPPEMGALLQGCTFEQTVQLLEARLPSGISKVAVYELAMSIAQTFQKELAAVPGVHALIAALREREIPICVASQSALPRVRLSLQICGLDSSFGDRVFTASMVARPKPAPDLFLHAAHTLGAEPGTCIVIEDSPSGVRAAVAAGMNVLGYAAAENPALLHEAGATTFTQMSDVLSLIGLS
jgi:HAD superfamily hydrolase (TIGR01509 family)